MGNQQPTTHKIAVMLSGSGRSFVNLCERIDRNQLHAKIALVVASRNCLGADKARDRGIPTKIITGEPTANQLDALVNKFGIDLIVLAGYLRRVPITPTTRGRIINIHPALLPAFGGQGMHGSRVHKAVLDAYAKGLTTESGCTVHFCDETYDTGSTILQRRCQIHDDDTPESLAARVFNLECEVLPDAIQMVFDRM